MILRHIYITLFYLSYKTESNYFNSNYYYLPKPTQVSSVRNTKSHNMSTACGILHIIANFTAQPITDAGRVG